MIGWGSGYGKLLLFGEHAAVHGYPAIGVALPQGIQVWIGSVNQQNKQHQNAESCILNGWTIHGMMPQHHSAFARLWEAFMRLLPKLDVSCPDRDKTVTVSSGLPYAMGFGSSGSLSVALAQAGMRYIGIEPSAEWLWNTANQLEAVFHGTPSGIDTGLAVFGGWQAFHPQQGTVTPKSLPLRTPLPSVSIPILVGAIPRIGTTRKLVERVGEQLKAEPEYTTQILTQLGTHASTMIQYIKEGEASPENTAAEVRQAQAGLHQLGLSTPELEEIFAFLYSKGALGCKLSGAGGGGAFYAVFADAQSAEKAQISLHSRLSNQFSHGNYHVQSLFSQ
ncbi:MAG: mevalonate kinase [Spirochaeta sp.]